MSLEELLRSGTVRKARPDPDSAARSLDAARRDLDTAGMPVESNRFDWPLSISYNAMLLAARALMFSKGYRASGAEGHVAVLKFLRASLRASVHSNMIVTFNGMRKKRHRAVYEEMDIVTEAEARRALKWASEFVDLVVGMVRKRES